jgi:hypothetical protein
MSIMARRRYETSVAAQNFNGHNERNETAVKDRTLEDATALKEKKPIPPQEKGSDRVSREPRGSIDLEYSRSEEPSISDAVNQSRRRRTQRNSVPISDRYRHDEKWKFWAPREAEELTRSC